MNNYCITFLIPNITLGGSEKSLIKLANILAENANNQIKIITIKSLDISQINSFPIPISERISFFSLNGISIKSFKVFFNLIKYTKGYRSKVFCCWSFSPSILGTLIKPFLNTDLLMLSIRDVYKQKSFFEKNLRNILFKRADVITANSSENLEVIKSHLNNDKILFKLLKNTIDSKKVLKLSKSKFEIESLNKSVINILSVGRLAYQKGFDILIESLSMIPSKYNYSVSIIGDGPMKNFLKELANKKRVSKNIRWLGAKNNPYPYYSNFDVLVFPSRHEGFPNVLLEAMVVGIPVISTDCLTGPKELLNNGEFGQLIATEDPISLSRAVINFFENRSKYIKIANKRKKQLIKAYDFKTVKDDYLEIFNCKNE